MSKFRMFIGVAMLVVLAGGWSLGQDKDKKVDDPPMKFRGMLPAGWKKLGLSEKQVQEIYKIQNEYGTKIDAFEVKIKQLKDEQKTAMEKVLTKAQKDLLKEIKSGEVPKDDK